MIQNRRGFFPVALAALTVMWAGMPSEVEAKPMPPAHSADAAASQAKAYLAKRGWTVVSWKLGRGNQELFVAAKREIGSGKSKKTINQNFAFKVVLKNGRLVLADHPTDY